MEELISSMATRLAIKFPYEDGLPSRITGKKGNPETEIKKEALFQKNVRVWGKTIEKILTKVETQQALRFIKSFVTFMRIRDSSSIFYLEILRGYE